MKRLVFVGVIACVMVVNLVQGQENSLSVSVEQAQDYAIEHNKTLKNAQRDIGLAEKQYIEARSKGLPQVSGNVDYMTNFNYEVEFNISGSSTPQTPDINMSLLDQGDVEVLDAISQLMSPSGPSTIKMSDQASAQVQVSQLIFNGQYWVGLEMARLAQDLSQKNLEMSELDIKHQVTNTYYLILTTEAFLEIINKNIENLENVLQHTQEMYEAGVAEKTDVDQIRINLSQFRNSKESTRRSIELNYNMLRFQLGLERGQKIMLTDDLASLYSDSHEGIYQKADSSDLGNNPRLKLINTQVELKDKQLDLEKWAYAPTLTGFYSYTEKILTTDFDLSPNSAAGFTLSIPVFSGGLRKSKLDQAKIELDKSERNRSIVKDQLELQEDQLKFELQSAKENYMTQKENVDVARRVYDNIYRKFKQGMKSSLDLTQANSNYLQAENNYVSAKLKLLQARLALDKLYNRL
jgi:outer membrane protein TolC